MRRVLTGLLLSLAAGGCAFAADPPDAWPWWRGPEFNGVARGDAPLTWSDKDHIAWKVPVPGRGHSSPVIWGDRLFLTTAVPTGAAPAVAAESAPAAPGGRGGPEFGGPPGQGGSGGRGPGGPGGRGGPGDRRGGFGGAPQVEQKFLVLAIDRHTGKTLWEKTATVATPHEGFHQQYGSFASPSVLVDASHVIAYFGSRVYCYTHEGQPVWQKDFGIKLRMIMSFGEGSSPALDGDKLVILLDQEGEAAFASFLIDKMAAPSDPFRLMAEPP